MLKKTVRYLILIIAFAFLLVFIATIILGYRSFFSFLTHLLKIENYEGRIEELITERRFIITKSLFLILAVLFMALFIFYERVLILVSIYIKELFVTGAQIVKTELQLNTRYILIIPFLASIYFAVSLPVSYDEAWTFLNFTQKGPLTSLSYYPAPNNHILHSLITNFTYLIPAVPPLIKLRISSILVNVLTLLVCAHFLRKKVNDQVAIVVTAIFPVLFMGIYYSYMSRGYGIVILCFISSFNFVFNIIKGNQTRDWVWFSFFSILGFFTMPSYLYPYIILNLIILLNNGKTFKKQFIAAITVASVVLLLYLPLIMVNGIKALYANRFVVPINRNIVWDKLPSFFTGMLYEIAGFKWYIVFVLFAVAVVFYFKKNNYTRQNLIMILIFLITPPVLLIVQSVIPFGRTFNFYGFVLVFLIILPFKDYLGRIKVMHLVVVLAAIQLCLVYNFNKRIKREEDYSIQSHNISSKIAGNHTYVINADLFETYLLFELKTHGFEKYQLIYRPFSNMSPAAITGVDYIIIDHGVDHSQKRKPRYSNPYYNVYLPSAF